MANDGLQVTGLTELRRELKAVDPAFPTELRKINLAVATDVAAATRSALDAMGGSAPLVTPTVKALAQQARAQVAVGGSGNSVGELVAMGNLWGASRYPQFPTRIQGGYALYPSIAHLRPAIDDRYLAMLTELLGRAFPD